MMVNSQSALKLIIVFSLLNISIYIGFSPGGVVRTIILLLQLLSGLLLVSYFFLLQKQMDMNLYFKVVFSMLILWSVYIISKSISFNLSSNITLFGHYLMAWTWLTPLAIVFGFNIQNWISIFNFLVKLFPIILVSTILLLVINPNDSYSYGIMTWYYLVPFLFLTYHYQDKRSKLAIIMAMFGFILLSILNSQRVNLLYIGLLFSYFAFNFFRLQFINIYKKLFVSIALLTLLGFAILQIRSELMANDSLLTDSRTFLFVELFDDMSENELLVGRGALGTYYSPYFESWNKQYEGGDSSTRSSIEIGYLEMILKGGVVMVILYLLFLLPAVYLGIFKSKNYISKMSGFMISVYIILWSISYIPIYSADFILLWMAAGTAISPSIRKIDNKLLINSKQGLIFASK
ncbi:MAG: hypothetical protein PHO27_10115 [Sulfuricurvum sp.]|nr:hypothetical protein [Sulfuricurvum sp.]